MDRLEEKRKNYMSPEAFIYHVKNCDYSNESLENILSEVKSNKFWGDIKWPDNHIGSNLVDQIEEQLKANNNEFRRFPNDFIHAQMSQKVYEFDKLKESDDPVYFINEKWKVLKIFKHEKYVAVLYMNESRKQLVLATKGIETSIFKSHISSQKAHSDYLNGILLNENITQLYQVSQKGHVYSKELKANIERPWIKRIFISLNFLFIQGYLILCL